MFYTKAKLESSFSSGTSVGMGDVYDSAYESMVLSGSTNSESNAMEKAYDARIDNIEKITGKRLINPIRNQAPVLDPDAVGARDINRALHYSNKPQLTKEFDVESQRLADAHSEYRDVIKPASTVEEDAAKIARDADKKASNMSSRYRDGGVSRTIASLAGGLVASASDPANIATMLLGPTRPAGVGAKALAWMAVKNGAVNAGVEAGMQPAIAKWRKEAGLHYSASHFAMNVASAFVLGAGFDAGVRLPYRGYKRARGMVPKLDDKGGVVGWHTTDQALETAALKAKGDKLAKAADGDVSALRELAEETGVIDDPVVRGALDHAENNDISFGRLDVDDGSGLERVAQALRHASDPEDNPPPVASRAPEATDVDQIPLSEIEAKLREKYGDKFFEDGLERAKAKALPADNPRKWQDEMRGRAENGEDIGAFNELKNPVLQLQLREYAVRDVIENSTDLLETSRAMRSHPEFAGSDGRTDFARTARALSKLSDDAFAIVEAGQIKPEYARLVVELQPNTEKHKSTMQRIVEADPKSTDEARKVISESLETEIGAYHQTILGGRGNPDSLKGGLDDVSGPEVKEQIEDLEAFNNKLEDLFGRDVDQVPEITDKKAGKAGKLGLADMIATGKGSLRKSIEQTTGLKVDDNKTLLQAGSKTGQAPTQDLTNTIQTIADRILPDEVKVEVRERIEAAGDELLQARVNIQTPEFKNWFGDSKVVDENGEPLVAYHGSNNKFGNFSAEKAGTTTGHGGYIGSGFYFSDTKGIARLYARTAIVTSKVYDAPEVIYDVHLSIKNPFLIDITNKGIGATKRKIKKMFGRDVNIGSDGAIEGITPDQITEKLKNKGFDGVVSQHNDNIREFVAFDPTQIKSVNNRGTFDPADPRILYQGVTGTYNPLKKLIQIATDNNPDPVQTFGHESIHAFRDLSLITDKEWSTLVDAANRSGWADNPTVRKSMAAYAERGYDEARIKELVLEEAIAEQFGNYLTKNIEPSPALKPVFERLKQFIERLRNALKGQGFQSFEDVFKAINQGDVKGRKGTFDPVDPRILYQAISDGTDFDVAMAGAARAGDMSSLIEACR